MMSAQIHGNGMRLDASQAPTSPAVALQATLVLGQGAYPPGTPLDLAVVVRNISASPVVLSFATTQRFDVIVESEVVELDRWSEGRAFVSQRVQLRWAPGEEIVFRDQWLPQSSLLPGMTGVAAGAPLGRGVYRLQAHVTGIEARLVTPADILVIAPPTSLPAGCTELADRPTVELPAPALARTVAPRDALVSMWQQSRLGGIYEGYTPVYLTPNDLRVVNQTFPLTVCLAAPGQISIP